MPTLFPSTPLCFHFTTSSATTSHPRDRRWSSCLFSSSAHYSIIHSYGKHSAPTDAPPEFSVFHPPMDYLHLHVLEKVASRVICHPSTKAIPGTIHPSQQLRLVVSADVRFLFCHSHNRRSCASLCTVETHPRSTSNAANVANSNNNGSTSIMPPSKRKGVMPSFLMCGKSAAAPNHVDAWVYVLVGFGIFGGMFGTLWALFVLHRNHRDKEHERQLQYWCEQVRTSSLVLFSLYST
jgi:hypothetical protein